jgi:signal transduction histidine kinase
VKLAAVLERDHVVFVIADDGPGIGGSRHEGGAHVGTRDVRERLATLYGPAAAISVRPTHPGAPRPGVTVELRIPREEE